MTGFDRFFKSVNNRYKRTDYDYDLQSGKVNYVYYENDSLDAFTQWYQYDQDLRLSNVMTSLDQVEWDNDASYNYYNHGPLSRMELGRRQVQGVDFAYTINGWQKGINSSTGLVKNDIGEDGIAGSMVGADVYGEVIGYYSGDYKEIKATTQPFELAYSGSNFDAASPGLYNGNIRNATVSLRGKLYYGDTDVSMSPIGYAYQYDQLNRYVSMRAFNNYDTATNSWQSGGAALQDYAENVAYDGNGNILTYIRHGNPTIGTPTGLTAMDSMTYSYNTNNNQLNSVADGVSSSNYTTDIDNEVGDNYKYDKNGELIFDSSQHLTITWNVRNKVASVYNDNTKLLITFGYDAMGNRVMKKDSNLNTNKCYTQWYILDAQGNPLGIYKTRNDSMWWQEADIYGSSRVGVYYADSLIYPKGFQITTDTFKMELWEGKRQYELTNHLGNVLTTVSDKKIMLSSNMLNGTGRNQYINIASYQPEVVSISDYGPGGMPLVGRNFSLSDDTNFRYGFNGQEKDDDIEGKGDLNTAEFWEYDTRLGRRWNLDIVPRVGLSDYSTFGDNPIFNSDPNGAYFFGLIGSTSEQRRTARDWAAATGGKIHDITGKNINVTYNVSYNAPDPMSSTGHAYVINEKTMHFLNGGGPDYGDPLSNLLNRETYENHLGIGQYNIYTGLRRGTGLVESPAIDPIDIFSGLLAGGLLRSSVGTLSTATTSAEATVTETTIFKTTNGELANFAKGAAKEMQNPNRYVPSDYLDYIAKNTEGFPDPKGSEGLMHYSTLIKNGKAYNIEVLYNESTNTIYHFKYTPKALGPLPATK